MSASGYLFTFETKEDGPRRLGRRREIRGVGLARVIELDFERGQRPRRLRPRTVHSGRGRNQNA
jgi:hypothetical protein